MYLCSMIYEFEEYKQKIKEAERRAFADRYAVATDPQDILKKHNILMDALDNEEFLMEMYQVYLQRKGVKK